jgi:hypothetical protein
MKFAAMPGIVLTGADRTPFTQQPPWKARVLRRSASPA